MHNLWLTQRLWCQRDQELRQEAQRWLQVKAQRAGAGRPRPRLARVQRWVRCTAITWRLAVAARRGASPLIHHEQPLEKPC